MQGVYTHSTSTTLWETLTPKNTPEKARRNYLRGFNGMYKDDEIKGSGNSLDFGARIYDPRLGRFLSMDRFANKFAHQSSYIFAGNTPIMARDINGDSLYLSTSAAACGLATEWNRILTNAYGEEYENAVDVFPVLTEVTNADGITELVWRFYLVPNTNLDINWEGDTYSNQLFELMVSDRKTRIFELNGEKSYPGMPRFLTLEDAGGGFTPSKYSGSRIYLQYDLNKSETNNYGTVNWKSHGATGLHEVLIHLHPDNAGGVGGNESKLMDDELKFTGGRNPHGGKASKFSDTEEQSIDEKR